VKVKKKTLTNGDVATAVEYSLLMGMTEKKHKAALKKLHISERQLWETTGCLLMFCAKKGRRGLSEFSAPVVTLRPK
jgi:hypothetical protein